MVLSDSVITCGLRLIGSKGAVARSVRGAKASALDKSPGVGAKGRRQRAQTGCHLARKQTGAFHRVDNYRNLSHGGTQSVCADRLNMFTLIAMGRGGRIFLQSRASGQTTIICVVSLLRIDED